MDRRKVLGGIVTLGGLIATGGMTGMACAQETKMQRFAQQGGDFSWKPHTLEPKEVAVLAHAAYHHKGYG